MAAAKLRPLERAGTAGPGRKAGRTGAMARRVRSTQAVILAAVAKREPAAAAAMKVRPMLMAPLARTQLVVRAAERADPPTIGAAPVAVVAAARTVVVAAAGDGTAMVVVVAAAVQP